MKNNPDHQSVETDKLMELNNTAVHKYPFGIIGNCAYLALVDKTGNVIWMCMPRFDSSFLFGSMLDSQKGGEFSIRPESDQYTSYQAYQENTNILETTFETESGSFKVVDFAPRFLNYERSYKPLMLMRKIVPIEGRPRIKAICDPRGEYGKKVPTKMFGSSHIRYMGLQDNLRLTTNISLNYLNAGQAFVLNETKYLALAWGAPLEAPLEATVNTFFQKTSDYWKWWVKNTTTETFYQERVIRSALTLKLHQYEDTGAIIAAATTSLPESPGSGRNWDYRFCWMRDSHYTLKALNDLSHFSELERYAEYIENITLNQDGRYNPLYPITLNDAPEETILDLKGYMDNNGPVRIGNKADIQIQNDVYGQVLVTLLPLFTDKRLASSEKRQMRGLVNQALDRIESTMNEPDNGLWEFRGFSQHFCYTFLFHWAGSQAALKIAKALGDSDMEAQAKKLIDLSAEQIEACYDPELGAYTQAIENKNMDASLLQLINMGYLDPNAQKTHQHLSVLEASLKAENGLFYRYRHTDDFGEPETTFLICAYWYVQALAKVGRLEEAIQNFEQLLPYSNQLGLLSEDVHAATGSQWGNFPQTYSHVGLINAAFAISRKLDKPIFLD
ncbi:MAG: glycoside hydrolase family 15 protein [Bacteroidota bacterium]